jgi:hypothetical protein
LFESSESIISSICKVVKGPYERRSLRRLERISDTYGRQNVMVKSPPLLIATHLVNHTRKRIEDGCDVF